MYRDEKGVKPNQLSYEEASSRYTWPIIRIKRQQETDRTAFLGPSMY